MHTTSCSAPAASTSPIRANGSNSHASPRRNAYATTLRTNIERLIPLEMMQARRCEATRGFATLERNTATIRFASVNNRANSTGNSANAGNPASAGSAGSINGSGISAGTAATAGNTPNTSAAATGRRSTSAPDDIDFLCAVASRDLVAQTAADIRKPDVWNEHLLDVLLALKRKQPDLLGASKVRVVASNLIPNHMALLTQSQQANRVRDPMHMTTSRGPVGLALGPASASATYPPVNHQGSGHADNASGHLSFIHDAQHYHIVNTKEAFFRAIISVRDEIDPIAVSKQSIDALIEDTADFLEDHWREYYRVVWTKMAKSVAI